MVKEMTSVDFYKFCKDSSPFQVLSEVTSGHIRGLDMLALRMVLARNKLPIEVLNVLLVYFYTKFMNTVFDRNDLMKVYEYWLKKRVVTFAEAVAMTEVNIDDILGK